MSKFPALSFSLLLTTLARCCGPKHVEGGYRGFSGAMSFISRLCQKYRPTTYTSAKFHGTSFAVWNLYVDAGDFISSMIISLRIATRSPELSWARAWLCSWCCRVRHALPVHKHNVVVCTLFIFPAMLKNDHMPTLRSKPPSSAGFPESSSNLDVLRALTVET